MFYDQYVKLCSKKGITPSRAAIENGISKTSVTRWKNGAIPNAAILEKLAKYFGVSTDYLLGYSQEENELVNEDEELTEYLQELKTRPEMRMMFQLAKGATKEDVEKAVKIIEAFLKK
ncbi:MAG: HTH cro/C1-type domain-containing protein [Oscillospiraceae bacterium]|jgi:transcriptional regulator with XRE-family HTH domain